MKAEARKVDLLDQVQEQGRARVLNDFANLFSYKMIPEVKQMLELPYKILAWFTGNQAGKTGGVAFSYVLRILSYHPVPNRNVIFFECENGHQFSLPGPFSLFPKPQNNICTFCGAKITIHERRTRIFRFASEILPTE